MSEIRMQYELMVEAEYVVDDGSMMMCLLVILF